jgi:2-oxoglutarate ferredoxin oxidoreductase subunit alpha
MIVTVDAHTAEKMRYAVAVSAERLPLVAEKVTTNLNRDDFVWMAGGPQGSGVDSAANIFGRACCYGGLHVYGKREYHSNIKGLHSYFHIRVSPNEIRADVERVDLLSAFDAESVIRHIWEVTPGGGVICDADALKTRLSDIPTLSPSFWDEYWKNLEEKGIKPETISDLLKEAEKDNVRVYSVPYMDLLRDIAQKIGEEKLSKLTRMLNVLALGVSFGLVDYNKTFVEQALRAIFRGRQNIIDMNLLALNAAYDYTKRNFKGIGLKLEAFQTSEKRKIGRAHV